MAKPVWASAQWHEVWFRSRQYPNGARYDRRRRTKASAEKLAAELRATNDYFEVWVNEVNRLASSA